MTVIRKRNRMRYAINNNNDNVTTQPIHFD